MHVLYRFYDGGDRLLYVGITNNPAARFKQHEHSKDWWDQVASITLEQHASRQELMDAERAAIIAERPAYNVAHSVTNPRRKRHLHGRQTASRLHLGAFVALHLDSGSCPVGEVIGLGDSTVTIRSKDWITGFYCGAERVVSTDRIVEAFFAKQTRDGEVLDCHLATIQAVLERQNRLGFPSDRHPHEIRRSEAIRGESVRESEAIRESWRSDPSDPFYGTDRGTPGIRITT